MVNSEEYGVIDAPTQPESLPQSAFETGPEKANFFKSLGGPRDILKDLTFTIIPNEFEDSGGNLRFRMIPGFKVFNFYPALHHGD